jgi:hypothetical protein
MVVTSPNTSLYTLGKGILTIEVWVGTTPPTPPLVDVGNCSSFEVEVTEEVLDHFSQRSGVRSKDKQITLETGYVLNFVLDENSVANLKMFLRATQAGDILSAAQALDLEYALTFTSDNPYGPNETWVFHKAKIRPNGAFNLISDEWATLSFTAEGLTDTANNPTSPYFTVSFSSSSSSISSSSLSSSSSSSL